MPATIKQIREAIAGAVGTIEGLSKSYPYLQAQVNPPQAEVYRKRFTYDDVQHEPADAGANTLFFGVRVYASRSNERTGQELFDELIEPVGPRSVKATIEADATLTELVDYVVVVDAEQELVVTVGAVDYFAQDFTVEVGR